VLDPAHTRVLVTGGSGFIGTNLMAKLSAVGLPAVNLDVAPPLDPTQASAWLEGDILDRAGLETALHQTGPTHVVHLAGRVDIRGKTLEDYAANTEGTSNLLAVIQTLPDLRRLVVASTQFVMQPGHLPTSETDYRPHTVYGESKVRVEELTRRSRVPWVIVRPTTIWGPYDFAYRRHFYWTLDRGLYLHPKGVACFRSLGFVGNVAEQLVTILSAPEHDVVGQTFYLGDPVLNLIEFVDALSEEIAGRPARTVSAGLVRVMAAAGDVLGALRLPTPITTSRYRSMTEDYVVPLEPTLRLTGPPHYSMSEAAEITVRWLRDAGLIRSSSRHIATFDEMSKH
jgi:nucleoside-diphosphate-sugar epimerase